MALGLGSSAFSNVLLLSIPAMLQLSGVMVGTDRLAVSTRGTVLEGFEIYLASELLRSRHALHFEVSQASKLSGAYAASSGVSTL